MMREKVCYFIIINFFIGYYALDFARSPTTFKI